MVTDCSASATSSDAFIPSARASLAIVLIVGWLWPVSIKGMKLRWTPASRPSFSCDSPAANRKRRNAAPNGSSKSPDEVPTIWGESLR